MGFIRNVINGIGTGAKKIFASDPSSYVESAGESLKTAIALAVKEGVMSKKEAAEIIRAERENERDALAIDKRIENGVQLSPSDKTDFRSDSTMEKVQSVNVEVKPAGQLPNQERASGGRDRDSKMK